MTEKQEAEKELADLRAYLDELNMERRLIEGLALQTLRKIQRLRQKHRI